MNLNLSKFINDDIYQGIYKYLVLLYEDDHNYLTDLSQPVLERAAIEIYNDIRTNDPKFKFINLQSDEFYYKPNKFNLNLFNIKRKYKLYVGLNALVAKNNYDVALHRFIQNQDEYYRYRSGIFVSQKENYRIEGWNIYPGNTLDGIISSIKPGHPRYDDYAPVRDMNFVINRFMHFIGRSYLSDPDVVSAMRNGKEYGGNILYPNDNNFGNFIVEEHTPDNWRFVNIDFDHIVHTSVRQMMDNICNQMIARVYSEMYYPEETTHAFLKDYRQRFDPADAKQHFMNEFEMWKAEQKAIYE